VRKILILILIAEQI